MLDGGLNDVPWCNTEVAPKLVKVEYECSTCKYKGVRRNNVEECPRCGWDSLSIVTAPTGIIGTFNANSVVTATIAPPPKDILHVSEDGVFTWSETAHSQITNGLEISNNKAYFHLLKVLWNSFHAQNFING